MTFYGAFYFGMALFLLTAAEKLRLPMGEPKGYAFTP